MKKIILPLLALSLMGCATTEKFNNNFATQNIAVVKNTTYDPIFSIKSKETTVLKINGKTVEDESSYKLPAGEHTLVVKCNYFETATYVLFGERTIKANLTKGHTYKLIPIPARKKSTGKSVCYPQFKDITEI